MAPELLENARASIQSDIYSLGLILYEMLTGAKWKRLYSRTPTPEKKALKVDNQWKHATLCCLEKAPAKRPRSVGAVSILLNTPPPRKWPVYGGAAIILFLLTLLAVWKLRPHHINPDAQLAVDLARRAIENPSQDGFNTAIADYKRALALDPKWAQPWAELAYAYAAASNARYIDGSTASVEARKAALRAIEIDPHLGKAVAALAWTDSLDFDEWPKAEERFRTALRLNPDDGAIHYWFGVHLRKKGRYKEAESHDQLALRLTHGNDPYVWYELSFLYWTSGQILKFHDHMQEELKAFPNSPWTRFLNARLLKLEGQYTKAEEELTFSQQLGFNSLTVLVERASLEEYKGDVSAARRDIAQLEQASQTTEIDGVLLAGDYAGLHDNNAAFKTLENAFLRKDNTLLSLATSPVLEPLHQDPRYIALLRRLHFTDQIMQQIGFN
jgi:Tfp pilus assembly protein PilF